MEWKYTPKHEILTDVKAKRELKKLNMTVERLPLIKNSDAALRSLRESGTDTPIGSVVKITRNSRTYGEGLLYYRKIIP